MADVSRPARPTRRTSRWVVLHGYPGSASSALGPWRRGFRGYVPGHTGSTLLRELTDDGREWCEHWGHLDRDGTPGHDNRCTCCPHPQLFTARPRRRRRNPGQQALFDLADLFMAAHDSLDPSCPAAVEHDASLQARADASAGKCRIRQVAQQFGHGQQFAAVLGGTTGGRTLMRFWLGTHMPHWLSCVDVPLLVSRTRLANRRSLPRARTSWVLDSGAFSELQRHGEWTITAREYIAFVRRAADEIGHLAWAAPMDWMTEDVVISGGTVGRTRFVGTRMSVAEHQRRTVANLLELRYLAADLPIVPVLQGQTLDDYKRIIDAYHRAGVDLTRERVVGLGSVCRRQGTREIAAIVADLAATGLRLHGFGVKTSGLATYAAYLHSADSLSWSYRGRRVRPCLHGRAGSEANCPHFALAWRNRVLAAAAHPQLDLLAETSSAHGPRAAA